MLRVIGIWATAGLAGLLFARMTSGDVSTASGAVWAAALIVGLGTFFFATRKAD